MIKNILNQQKIKVNYFKENFIHLSNIKYRFKKKEKKKPEVNDARLKISYEKEIVAKLMQKLSVKNKHEVPKIDKVILNMGLGEDASDSKKLKACLEDMSLIAGQKPVITNLKNLSQILKQEKSQRWSKSDSKIL